MKCTSIGIVDKSMKPNKGKKDIFFKSIFSICKGKVFLAILYLKNLSF